MTKAALPVKVATFMYRTALKGYPHLFQVCRRKLHRLEAVYGAEALHDAKQQALTIVSKERRRVS